MPICKPSGDGCRMALPGGWRNLSASFRKKWRKARSASSGLVAVMTDSGATQLWREGKPQVMRQGGFVSSRVLMPAGAVLMREVELPLLAAQRSKAACR